MSSALLEAILAYLTIPAYVVGLLVLIYIIARFELGLSLSKEITKSVKSEISQERQQAPVSSYIIVMVVFILCIVLAITTQRRQHI